MAPPPLISILPSSVANSIDPYLPSNAGEAMMQIGHHANTLSPVAGFAVFAGYVVVVIVAVAVLLVMRITAPTKSITVAATPVTSTIEQGSASASASTSIATIAPLTAEPASSAAPIASTDSPNLVSKAAPPKKSTTGKPAGSATKANGQPDAPNQFGAAGVSTAF